MFVTKSDTFILATPEEKKRKLWRDTFLLIFLLDCISTVFLIPYEIFVKILPLHNFNLFGGNIVYMTCMIFLYMLRDHLEEKKIWIFLAISNIFFCVMLYVRATSHFTDLYVPFFAFLPLLLGVVIASEYLPTTTQFLVVLLNILAVLLFQDAINQLFQLETIVYVGFIFFLFFLVHFVFSFIFSFLYRENVFYTEERGKNHDMRQRLTVLEQTTEIDVEEIEKMVRVFSRFKGGDTTVRLATNHAAYTDMYAIMNSVLAKQEKLMHDGAELQNIKDISAQIAETIHHQYMMNTGFSLVRTGTCLDTIISVLNRDQKTKDLFTL